MLLFPSFCSRFLFEYNSFHLTIWYLSTTRRIRPAVPTPSHVPLSSTNCAERSRKNKEQKKPSYFIKHHDLSGICRMTLQPGFPIQIFHLSSGRRPYRFAFAIPVICLLCKLLRIFRSNIKVLLQCFSRQNTTHSRVCGL